MSDDGSAPVKPITDVADIQALLSEVAAKKNEFATLVLASSNEIVESKTAVTSARGAALAEIDQSKTAIKAAKAGVDEAVAEVTAAKATVGTAKVSALAEIDQSKTAITAVKATVEAALTEIDKAKTAVATAKGAIEATQQAANTDLAAINQSKMTVDKLQAAATAQAESLNAENNTISAKIEDLQKKAAPLEEILATLTNIKEEAEAEKVAVAANIKTITDAKTNFETLNTQTQTQYDALVARKVTLDAQISEIVASHSKVQEIYKTLFDDTGSKKSVRSEIEELRKQIAAILKASTEERAAAQSSFEEFKTNVEQQKSALVGRFEEEFQQLHRTLESEIRALLPSAGAAGLASTYYDAKSRYAPTSFAGKPGAGVTEGRIWTLKWWRGRFGYNPASLIAMIFFYALFIFPVLGIVTIFYELIHDMPNQQVAALDLKIVTLRVLIAVPLATISAFGFMSLRQYRRLYEEYNHKQRVMELYASFRKEIAENGTEEQKKRLLTIMLDAVADKSYLATAATDDKDGDQILTKLNNMASVLNTLIKTK